MKKGMHTRGLTRWGTQFYVVLQRLLYYSTRPFELAFEKQKKGVAIEMELSTRSVYI